MNALRDICEQIAAVLAANATVGGQKAKVLVEDKGSVDFEVKQALGKTGVLILVAATGHRRSSGSGSSPSGDVSIEVTVFENPKLNRASNANALTVTAAAEAVVTALHGQSVTLSDGTTTRLVYGDMARADADDADARMVITLTAFLALDPSNKVTWGAGAAATVGEVLSKTVRRGGTNVYEANRSGSVGFAGTRDRHWEIALSCAVAATFSEASLPQLGETFAYGGKTYFTDAAELSYSGEDTATVRLSGRTIS